MDTREFFEASQTRRAGTSSSPETVHRFLSTDVDCHEVDHATLQTINYGDQKNSCTSAVAIAELSSAAAEFDLRGLRIAILGSQQNSQIFSGFSCSPTDAGVLCAIAFLLAQRAPYCAQKGDQRTEWIQGRRNSILTL